MFRFHLVLAFSAISTIAMIAQPAVSTKYATSHAVWQQELRNNRNTYLKLIALEKIGDSLSFGASASADLNIALKRVPDIIGQYRYANGILTFNNYENVAVTDKDGTPISNAQIDLENGSSELMLLGDLSWRIITRGGELYLRMWYEDNPPVQAFRGFEWMPLNPNMIFDANMEYYASVKRDTVQSKLGVIENTDFIGEITFNYKNTGQTVRVGRGGFLMIADHTSGDATYGGGRYIDVDLPEANGPFMLDFNYLYNPPCAFSDLTTCLIPPPDNRLPFAVNAGETVVRLK